MKDLIDGYLAFLNIMTSTECKRIARERSCLADMDASVREQLSSGQRPSEFLVTEEAKRLQVDPIKISDAIDAFILWRESMMRDAKLFDSSGSDTMVDENGTAHVRLRNR